MGQHTADVVSVADGVNDCVCLYGVLQWTSGLWAASWPSFSLDGLCFLAPIVSFPTPHPPPPFKPGVFSGKAASEALIDLLAAKASLAQMSASVSPPI